MRIRAVPVSEILDPTRPSEPTPRAVPTASIAVHVEDDLEEEEDNRLPSRWLLILYATMVFAFGYWFVDRTARPAPRGIDTSEVQAPLEAPEEANPTSP